MTSRASSTASSAEDINNNDFDSFLEKGRKLIEYQKDILEDKKEPIKDKKEPIKDKDKRSKFWKYFLIGLFVLKIILVILSFTYQAIEGFDLAKELVLKIFGANEASLILNAGLLGATLSVGFILATFDIISYFCFEYSLRKKALNFKEPKLSEEAENIENGMKLLRILYAELGSINKCVALNNLSSKDLVKNAKRKEKVKAYIAELNEDLDKRFYLMDKNLSSKKVKIASGALVILGAITDVGSTAYFSFGFGLLIAGMCGVTGGAGFAIAGLLVAIFVAAKIYHFKQLNAAETISTVQSKFAGMSRQNYNDHKKAYENFCAAHKLSCSESGTPVTPTAPSIRSYIPVVESAERNQQAKNIFTDAPSCLG